MLVLFHPSRGCPRSLDLDLQVRVGRETDQVEPRWCCLSHGGRKFVALTPIEGSIGEGVARSQEIRCPRDILSLRPRPTDTFLTPTNICDKVYGGTGSMWHE